MDFSDSESDTGSSKNLDKLHEKKMKKLDNQKKNWGKNRAEYYNSDTQYFDIEKDDDVVRAEEREIKLIQQQQASLMSKMDFGLESLLGNSISSASTAIGKKNDTKSTIPSKKLIKSKQGTTIISIEERVRHVLSTAPELLAFLSQYLTYSQELSDVIPLLTKNLVQIKEFIDISPIVSLIKLRQQLLLSFCSCILYYIYLKSMNKNTIEHPVMTKLLALQTLIDGQEEFFAEIRSTLLDIQVKFILPKEEYESTMAKRKAHQIERYGDGDDDDNDDNASDDESAVDYYNRLSSASKAQKAARAEIHKSRTKRVKLGHHIIDEGIRRGIGKKIDANIGLRRQKSKKQIKHGTTRGKLRQKHETAITKRRSIVREYKGSQGIDYSGEATIKKGLIRSTRLG